MQPLSQATRPLMWNVSHGWVMYVLFIAALVVFAWGVYRRISVWCRGKEDKRRFTDWAKRLCLLARETLLQKQVRNSFFPAIFHSLIFYSFGVLVITTLIVMIEYDAGQLLGLKLNLFQGFVYVFFSVASELAGVLVLIGVGMAAYRRWVIKPESLPSTAADGPMLLLLAGIVVTGYVTEVLRIAVLGDPWKMLSPVGWGVAALFAGTGVGEGKVLHASLWWGHTVLAMSWVALVPFTKFTHLLLFPTNIFFSKLEPRGALQRVDMERMMEADGGEAELQVGIQKISDLTWKQRLDLDTCISCGRCDDICPAHMAHEQQFSPRHFLARLKESMNGGNGHKPAQLADIVGSAFEEDYIWSCRTCTACMEVCPGLIEHVDTLMEIRRNEALIQGRMPADAARAIRMLESNGNPFGPQADRVDWISQMNIRVVGPGEKVDVLYWIGCCATFDPQKRKIATDLCLLMDKCGIDYGVLGVEEKCCGDPARVIGNELLFQQIAKEQVEILRQRQFEVILVTCPHCYNVLANEYNQFGGDFKVVHHSEFLHEMLWLGELTPRFGAERNYAYHDPCYLGRYQKIYDSPREVIRSIPNGHVIEMPNHHGKSMCCGAGGGHYWMDLKKGERINNLRVKQAREAGADTIVTGCAYCLHMLEDSVKLIDYDREMRVVDIGSLMLESLTEPRKVKVSSAQLSQHSSNAAAV